MCPAGPTTSPISVDLERDTESAALETEAPAIAAEGPPPQPYKNTLVIDSSLGALLFLGPVFGAAMARMAASAAAGPGGAFAYFIDRLGAFDLFASACFVVMIAGSLIHTGPSAPR